MNPMRYDFYVASSWRNERQPEVVSALREIGYRVYDFRNPAENDHGFHWSETEALEHPIAVRGFQKDMEALRNSDACILLMPCGRSAHLEFGYAIGARKETFILLSDGEPELMYRMADKIFTGLPEMLEHFRSEWSGFPGGVVVGAVEEKS